MSENHNDYLSRMYPAVRYVDDADKDTDELCMKCKGENCGFKCRTWHGTIANGMPLKHGTGGQTMYDELVKRLREEASGWCINCCYRSGDYICGAPDDRKNDCDIASKLQAADAIEELSKPRWIPVSERLPENGVHVLLSCKCGAGAYVCDGFHTEKYSTPTQFYEDIDADYNEDTDEYYFPEGWWEVIKNWDDYSCVAIEDKVTHWMPLPEPPKEE